MLQGQRELQQAGFTCVQPLATAARHGKWFRALRPQSTEPVLVLRQSAGIWHAFGRATWTASHTSAARCCDGGLGDAIGTDAELASYARLVRRAPEKWAEEFWGLGAAKQQVSR